jgi:hypothetical protein
LIALALVPACGTTYAPALVAGKAARIDLVATRPADPDEIVATQQSYTVEVHDFANGCPAVKMAVRSKGYRGSVEAQINVVKSFSVPTGHRLVFTTEWSLQQPLNPIAGGVIGYLTHRCFSVVSFVPAAGGAYVIRFATPDRMKTACGATAERLIWGANHQSASAPPEGIAYPGELEGEAAHQQGGLCALSP